MIDSATTRNRWLVVLAAGIGMILGMPAIILYTIGIFFDPISRDIGLTRAQFGGGMLAVTLALAIAVPFIGVVVDRFGVRRAVFIGALLLAAGLGLLATATVSPLTYIAGLAVAGLFGAGVSPVGYTRAVATSFARGRGTAMGVTLTIVGTGTVILPPLTAMLIGRFGWRGGFLCLGALVLLTIPINYMCLRPPQDGAASPSLKVAAPEPGETASLLRDRPLWLMLIGFTLVAIAIFGFMLHLVPLALTQGITLTEAARYASLVGVSGLVSRLIVGVLCDLIPPHFVMFACAIMAAGAIELVALQPSLIALTAVALGFVVGAEVDLLSILTARYYAGRLYGRVYSLLYAPTIIGTGLSSLWIGAMADRIGYATPLHIGALFGVIGGALFLLLPRPKTAPLPSSQPSS